MTAGITMALGEHALGISSVDRSVFRAAADFLHYVVVCRVEYLAAVDAAGVVPEQAVVERRLGNLRA